VIRVALETSTARGSVAVGRGDRLLAEVSLGSQRRHAELLVPALDAALALAGVERTAIGSVVVGSGPGSFTGVRVAGATAKGLVAALGVPLLAYPSLLALAAAVPSTRPVCPLFDARRGEVYAGCWRVGPESLEVLLAPRVGPAEEVAAAAAAGFGGERTLFVGDGAIKYADALESAEGAVSRLPIWPRASDLLWLAERHGDAGLVSDVSGWQPEYVRASSAERGVVG
jgi:tRNA threonylcarbamoyladenosine biosynthesis protein TsaB